MQISIWFWKFIFVKIDTAKNAVISPDFLVWKFCEKAQFLHSSVRIAGNYVETVPFSKMSTPGNQVKLRYFLECDLLKVDIHLFISHQVSVIVFVEYQQYPAGNYLFKVNNGSARKMCKICWRLTMKTSQQRQWRVLVLFFLTLFEHVSYLFLVLLLFVTMQVNVCWVLRKTGNGNLHNFSNVHIFLYKDC